MTRSPLARLALAVALSLLPVAAVLLVPAAAQAAEGGLTIFPDPVQLVILLVLFMLLIVPANRLLFEPLLGVLDERDKQIEGARERAAGVAAEADRVLGEYEASIGEARKSAEGERRKALDEARREQSRVTAEARGSAEEELARARSGVAEALEQARSELRGQSEQIAREAASQVLGRSLS